MFVEDAEILLFNFLNCSGETFPVKIRKTESFHIQGKENNFMRKKVLQFSSGKRIYYFHCHRTLETLETNKCVSKEKY
jgi:hypothetical protein